MATQWHDGQTTDLPPVGTRILVYHPDLADWDGDAPWYGLTTGTVERGPDDGEHYADTHGAIFARNDGSGPWWWAFAPAPPEGQTYTQRED